MVRLGLSAAIVALNMVMSAGSGRAAAIDYTLTSLGGSRYEEVFYPRDIVFGRRAESILELTFNGEGLVNFGIQAVSGNGFAPDDFPLSNPLRDIAEISFVQDYGNLNSLTIGFVYLPPAGAPILPPAPSYQIFTLAELTFDPPDYSGYANLISSPQAPGDSSNPTAPVPEPASALILGGALIGLIANRKRC